jgi:hypothetical protein
MTAIGAEALFLLVSRLMFDKPALTTLNDVKGLQETLINLDRARRQRGCVPRQRRGESWDCGDGGAGR